MRRAELICVEEPADRRSRLRIDDGDLLDEDPVSDERFV